VELAPAFLSAYLTMPSSLFIKNAVDNFVYSRNIPLLMTYAEAVYPASTSRNSRGDRSSDDLVTLEDGSAAGGAGGGSGFSISSSLHHAKKHKSNLLVQEKLPAWYVLR
jgi:hypothetical protein